MIEEAEHIFDYVGVFHTRHENADTGRVWEGVIKYQIGAFLDQPDVTPDRRLSVSVPC